MDYSAAKNITDAKDEYYEGLKKRFTKYMSPDENADTLEHA